MAKTLLDSEGLKLYDQLIKEYIANKAGGGGSGGGTGDGIPKTGDRGVLAGFNTLNDLSDPSEVTINASSPDDTRVFMMSSGANITFEVGEAGKTFVKHVLVANIGNALTLTLPESGNVLFDNMSGSYTTSVYDLFIYVWYGDFGIIYTKQIM